MKKQENGDIWISVVGDSVTRSIFLHSLRNIENLKVYRTWEHPLNAGPSTSSDINYHLNKKGENPTSC